MPGLAKPGVPSRMASVRTHSDSLESESCGQGSQPTAVMSVQGMPRTCADTKKKTVESLWLEGRVERTSTVG